MAGLCTTLHQPCRLHSHLLSRAQQVCSARCWRKSCPSASCFVLAVAAAAFLAPILLLSVHATHDNCVQRPVACPGVCNHGALPTAPVMTFLRTFIHTYSLSRATGYCHSAARPLPSPLLVLHPSRGCRVQVYVPRPPQQPLYRSAAGQVVAA
eukprot:1159306-Pelagomonas_calceolata.AAC.24